MEISINCVLNVIHMIYRSRRVGIRLRVCCRDVCLPECFRSWSFWIGSVPIGGCSSVPLQVNRDYSSFFFLLPMFGLLVDTPLVESLPILPLIALSLTPHCIFARLIVPPPLTPDPEPLFPHAIRVRDTSKKTHRPKYHGRPLASLVDPYVP